MDSSDSKKSCLVTPPLKEKKIIGLIFEIAGVDVGIKCEATSLEVC